MLEAVSGHKELRILQSPSIYQAFIKHLSSDYVADMLPIHTPTGFETACCSTLVPQLSIF
jgi:hypothetical protein